MLTFDSPRICVFILRFRVTESMCPECCALSLLSHPASVFTSVYGYWLRLKRKLFFYKLSYILLYLTSTSNREWCNLTGVILRHHRFWDDCFQGVHPLSLIALLLAHEDELPIRRLHNYPTLPFVASGPFRDTLSNWIPMILWANKNNPKLNGILWDNKKSHIKTKTACSSNPFKIIRQL